MWIELDPGKGDEGLALREPDDFKGFAVRATAPTVADDLRALGRPADDEHVYVDPAVLLRLAGERAEDPAWLESLAGMTAFAAEHGWVDEAGFIRAHVEPRG